jgi:hypothetical protein
MDVKPKKTKLKPIIWILIICIPILTFILPLAGFLTFSHFYIKWEESQDIKFDLELWHSGSKDKLYNETDFKIDAPRIKMCRDFIAEQPWKWKTKNELQIWLGKSDNFPFLNGWDFNYWVGLQRGPMKMDSAWLCFLFDNEGKAIEAKMMQD